VVHTVTTKLGKVKAVQSFNGKLLNLEPTTKIISVHKQIFYCLWKQNVPRNL